MTLRRKTRQCEHHTIVRAGVKLGRCLDCHDLVPVPSAPSNERTTQMLWNDDNHLWQKGDVCQHLFTGRYGTVEKVGRQYIHVRLHLDDRLIRTLPTSWRFLHNRSVPSS